MSNIDEFWAWAKQFIAIQDSHVKEFLGSVGDLNLHEMKVLFSERYQGNIEFSYVLQIETGEYIRDLHIEKIKNDYKLHSFYIDIYDDGSEDGSGQGEGYFSMFNPELVLDEIFPPESCSYGDESGGGEGYGFRYGLVSKNSYIKGYKSEGYGEKYGLGYFYGEGYGKGYGDGSENYLDPWTINRKEENF